MRRGAKGSWVACVLCKWAWGVLAPGMLVCTLYARHHARSHCMHGAQCWVWWLGVNQKNPGLTAEAASPEQGRELRASLIAAAWLVVRVCMHTTCIHFMAVVCMVRTA